MTSTTTHHHHTTGPSNPNWVHDTNAALADIRTLRADIEAAEPHRDPERIRADVYTAIVSALIVAGIDQDDWDHAVSFARRTNLPQVREATS